MTDATLVAERRTCTRCATELAPALLSCPVCHSLVHVEQLTTLARAARAAEAEGDTTRALELWRETIALLPEDSEQYPVVSARIAALGQAAPTLAKQVRAQEAQSIRSRFAGKGGAIGTAIGSAVLLLWKLKFVVVFVLTKLKLLLLGFTKMGTVLSMLATIGVYWSIWGWPFALGFVLSIYVHEMGHVSALRHYGIRASAPMFVPFVGAFVRLKESLHGDRENAMVGLAGPLWGLGASLAAYGAFLATGRSIFGAIAHSGAWLNLFNLLPVWQLDGGRGFSAMSRNQRLVAAGAVLAAFAVTRDGLLLILGLVGVGMAFVKPSQSAEWRITAYYVALVWTLAMVSQVAAPELGALRGRR